MVSKDPGFESQSGRVPFPLPVMPAISGVGTPSLKISGKCHCSSISSGLLKRVSTVKCYRAKMDYYIVQLELYSYLKEWSSEHSC